MKKHIIMLCVGLSTIVCLLAPILAQANPACTAQDSTCIQPVHVKVATSTVAVDTEHCVTLSVVKAIIVLGHGGGDISQDCPPNMLMQKESDKQVYVMNSGAETVQATCCPIISTWQVPA